MTLHATAVEILIEKGRFEPEVALGIAEAIEVTVVQSQFVTVPILDARLHDVKAELRVVEEKLRAEIRGVEETLRAEMKVLEETLRAEIKIVEARLTASIQEFRAEAKAEANALRAEMQAIKAELVRWVFLAMLGSVALSTAAQSLTNAFLR